MQKKYASLESITYLVGKIKTMFSQIGHTHTSDEINGLSERYAKLDTIENGANKYVLPIANDSTLGGVQIGDNITQDENGKISIVGDNVSAALGYTPIRGWATSFGTVTLVRPFLSDLFHFEEGSNITISQSGDDGIKISATNTTYRPATETANGLMSAADKVTLNSLNDQVTSMVAITDDEIDAICGDV